MLMPGMFMAGRSNPGRLHHPPGNPSIPSFQVPSPPIHYHQPIHSFQHQGMNFDLDVLDPALDAAQTHDSTLASLQQSPYNGDLFLEDDEDDLSQSGVDSSKNTPAVSGRQASGRGRKKAKATKKSISEPTLHISLDYCLYVNVHNPHISVKQRAASTKSDWDKIVPSKDDLPYLNTNLMHRQWDELRDEILRIIGNSQRNLDVFLDQVRKTDNLKFHLYISNSHIFPFRRAYYCSSDEELRPFAEEVVKKPLQKVFIRVIMDDPSAQEKSDVAKEKSDKQKKKVEKILAIAVGPDKERVPLQREQARQLQNPRSDVSGDPIGPWVVRLRQHLEKKSNAKPSEVIFWPHKDDQTLVLRINHNRLWAWANVLEAKSSGHITDANRHVDMDTPPNGSTFQWERRSVISPLKHRAAPGNSHKRLDGRLLVANQGQTAALPRQVAGCSTADGNGLRSPASRGETLDSDAEVEGREEPLDLSNISIANINDVEIVSKCSSNSIEYMNDVSIDSSRSVNHLDQSSVISARQSSCEHPRKMARSPSGYPTCDFRCMSVHPRDSSPSQSPTRKSRSEPRLPLLPAGKHLTMDEFLQHCNIEVDDPMCQILIKGHDVKHWSFFRGKSDEQLMRIGFTRGLATHLSDGASELELTMVQQEFPEL
ncbi:hypothetical protein PGT21_028669 [Puccinia graminis f. sp. tritici]|uniref:Uncharacterized protein n=1 Tax=Puccinia graminis f. sp. tritici TaxID=56615 RepID=A0A5B0Q4V0_PUCGR|nr:hypothetical protein PGT21_028669 [Puccinia graminis f. sp. tritici]KAA1108079.1 hypothetical protein PGTUg99_028636 [Puccinia graminis f. sp. tritici]